MPFSCFQKYGLHDCTVDTLWIEKNKLVLQFNTGVYELDSTGTEKHKTSPCKMFISLHNLNENKIWEHVQITRTRKSKIREIPYNKFVETVAKQKMDISINFFSPFNNTVLLKGYMQDGKYDIVISETISIELVFD